VDNSGSALLGRRDALSPLAGEGAAQQQVRVVSRVSGLIKKATWGTKKAGLFRLVRLHV